MERYFGFLTTTTADPQARIWGALGPAIVLCLFVFGAFVVYLVSGQNKKFFDRELEERVTGLSTVGIRALFRVAHGALRAGPARRRAAAERHHHRLAGLLARGGCGHGRGPLLSRRLALLRGWLVRLLRRPHRACPKHRFAVGRRARQHHRPLLRSVGAGRPRLVLPARPGSCSRRCWRSPDPSWSRTSEPRRRPCR